MHSSTILNYSVQSGRSVSEIVEQSDEVKYNIASVSTTLSSDTSDNAEEINESIHPFLESPYSYNHSESEQVLLNSGALVYEVTDYVLPGINGLDLEFTRRYNSQDAKAYSPKAVVSAYTTYTVSYWVSAFWYVSGLGEVMDNDNSTAVATRTFYSKT